MHYVSDLHLHSKYSRAVSKEMTLVNMSSFAKHKGINILSTTDWTHPLWFKEIRVQLTEAQEGLFRLKSQIPNLKSQISSKTQNPNVQNEPFFLLSTEIASIYSQNGKLRRVHNLIFAPSFETAEKIIKELQKRGCNLMADGRPIIGMSSRTLFELVLEIDERCLLIPCHIWTPHFGIYGSASGFNSLDDAFGDLKDRIYGIETGLSSDPEMNWEIEELKNRSIISTSDAHSLPKMGREATVFELEEPTYENIRRAIMRKSNDNRIVYTIEFYPEEGKYHFSGHRNCQVVYGPSEIRKDGDICPKCKRKLTEGVLFRVQELASDNLLGRVEEKESPYGIRWYTDKHHRQPPYVKLVPLLEIIAEALGSTVFSVKTKAIYDELCVLETRLGSEFDVLLKVPIETIAKSAGEKVANGVKRVRSGNIVINPGYDGEYGKVKIWANDQPLIEKVSNGEPQKEVEEEQKVQMGLEI